jgi:hypothetical protein
LWRVLLRTLVDGAVDRQHEARAIGQLAANTNARVLQLEAVVATDERDVRIVLHDDVLHTQIAIGRPLEWRVLGRRHDVRLVGGPESRRRLDDRGFGFSGLAFRRRLVVAFRRRGLRESE